MMKMSTNIIISGLDCPPAAGDPPLEFPLEVERTFDQAANGWWYTNSGVRMAAWLLLTSESPFNLAQFDNWVQDDSRPFEDGAREEVLRQRRRLLRAAKIGNDDALHFGARYLQLLQRYNMREAFMHPLALKGRDSSRAHAEAASAPRKVTLDIEKRIVSAYRRRVAAGEAYGAKKALSVEFGVTPKTISRVVKAAAKRNRT